MSRRSLAALWGTAAVVLVGAAPASAALGLLAKFGSSGAAEGQFFNAVGSDSDAQGNVYIAENDNHRIQKVDENGNFLRMWGWGVATGANAFEVCTTGCRGGSPGLGDGQFRDPQDVAVDSAGFVYTVEGEFGGPTNSRVQKFDGDGNFVTKWGGPGSGEGELGTPYGIAVDAANKVYVAETGGNRVSRFDSSGTFERMWGWGVDTGANALEACTSTCQAGLEGFGSGQFLEVYGVAVAPGGQIFTLDDDRARVGRWDADGNLFAEFDADEGPGTGFLTSIEVDGAGFVYVVDSGGGFPDTFRRFTADGALTDRIVCNHAIGGVGGHPSGKLFVGGTDDVRVFGEGGVGACDFDVPPAPGGGGGGGGGGLGGSGGVGAGLTFVGNEGLTINDGARFTNDPDVTLTIRAATGAGTVLISNDGGFATAVTRPVVPATNRYGWTLDRDPGQDERLPKTVYARFAGAGGTSPLTFTDDIILDTIAPTVTQATLSTGTSGRTATAAAVRRRARRFTLRLRARDNASGVSRLQLATNTRRPQKARRFKTRTTFRARRAPRYVRVTDAAGNRSRWRRLGRR